MLHQTSDVHPVHQEADHPAKSLHSNTSDEDGSLVLRRLRFHDLAGESSGQHCREDGQDPGWRHGLHGEAVGRRCEKIFVLEDCQQESAGQVDPERHSLDNDQPGPAGRHGVGLDAVEYVDDAEEESRHEERLSRVRESTGEGPAVHDEACGDYRREGNEEHKVADEDYFADCLEAGEFVWLGVQEGGDAACCHCAGEPCEGEASLWSVWD